MKSKHRLYQIWYSMNYRCGNKDFYNYKMRWGRWIKVCKRRELFENFLKDMESTYQEWLQLDRIDNNWNYSKTNCRWSTRKENCNNKTNNHRITYNGKTKNLKQRWDLLWVSPSLLYGRLKKWWPMCKVFSGKRYSRRWY